MFKTLLAKEIREMYRTWKLVILLAIFIIVGLISPILAKYTPALLKTIPNLPAGLEGLIPEPKMADAIAQYIKNINPLCIIIVILIGMGMIAQEKERGTAAMLVVKPVHRRSVILSKWLALFGSMVVAVLLSGLACYLYTMILFGPLPIGRFLALNLLVALFLGVYLTVALFASSLAKTQTTAAAGAFGGFILLLLISSLPWISDYLPGQLLNWGGALVLGGDVQAWPAVLISISLIAALLVAAILKFEREEI